MEKAKNVFSIPTDMGWSDLGTWNSLHAYLEKDEQDNFVQADYQICESNKNCFIRTSKDKLVVIKGLENFIVVDEEDVLLIYPKDQEQEIKQVRQGIEEQFK